MLRKLWIVLWVMIGWPAVVSARQGPVDPAQFVELKLLGQGTVYTAALSPDEELL
jgi:hypothetical protein